VDFIVGDEELCEVHGQRGLLLNVARQAISRQMNALKGREAPKEAIAKLSFDFAQLVRTIKLMSNGLEVPGRNEHLGARRARRQTVHD
jgi:hypothetical protein